MNMVKFALGLAAIALVSACSMPQETTRNAGFQDPPKEKQGAQVISFAQNETDPDPTETIPAVRVEQIDVIVPRNLTVSEANRYLPQGDIVWREDPIGDRHAQVQEIMRTAFAQGTQTMDGPTPVSLFVQVMRFHALTEKARYTTGGVHAIKFGLAVRDLNTGQLLMAPRIVEADLDAFGGAQAKAAEDRGQTQKVRITNHLAEVIRQELTMPNGFENPNLGLIQAMNKF